MDIDRKSDFRVKIGKTPPRKVGPPVDGQVGGYANTMKGKIHVLEGMSNQKISVPTAKVQKAYDHESSLKAPMNKTNHTFKSRMNSTQRTFGGFTSKRSSCPGFQTSTHATTKEHFY